MNRQSLVSLFIFAVFLLLAAGSSDDRPPEQIAKYNCEDTTMAFIMSRRWVEKNLKAPSTAKFPSSHSEGVKIIYQDECKHKVWAYVDAQNSFGAMIRTQYYVEVQNEYGTDTWRLLDIQM